MRKIGELKQILKIEETKDKDFLKEKIEIAKKYGKEIEAKNWRLFPETDEKKRITVWIWRFYK